MVYLDTFITTRTQERQPGHSPSTDTSHTWHLRHAVLRHQELQPHSENSWKGPCRRRLKSNWKPLADPWQWLGVSQSLSSKKKKKKKKKKEKKKKRKVIVEWHLTEGSADNHLYAEIFFIFIFSIVVLFIYSIYPLQPFILVC